MAEVRHNVGEAIRYCNFRADRNPLAVEWCKVAFLIESHESEAPIGHLNHHVKRGDSLVGVFNMDVLHFGIPYDAYTA